MRAELFPLSMSLALRLARAVTCRAGIALSWYKVWVSSGQLSFMSDTFTYNVYVMVGMIKKIIIVLPNIDIPGNVNHNTLYKHFKNALRILHLKLKT